MGKIVATTRQKSIDPLLEIDLSAQRLSLFRQGEPCFSASVSTAAKGAGELLGSEQTPRGWHCVRAKIGAGAPLGAVFVGRRQTGEIFQPLLAERHPERDWILTRILWLSGREPGVNRLGKVDTMRRYIYIHGCPDREPMGQPASHGCIRMRNREIVTLFELVPAGCLTYIKE